jgi:hypothetical protein
MSDTLKEYGRAKAGTRTGGVELRKKPKDLRASERESWEEREHGEGGDVYATLLQSDTVKPYGRAKTGTRPLGVGMRKKP